MPELITVVGLITTLGAALIGLTQTDIKRVVAYSTLNSLGLMMVALGSGAVGAAMLYLFVHAFFKALLFLASGSVIHATEEQEVDKLGGLWGKMPITAPVFVIGAAAMAGLIPFSGFWAKDEILAGLYHGPLNHVALVLVLISLPITALYMTRVVLLTFFGEPKDHHVFEHAHESPPAMTAPIALLAGLTLVGGFVIFEGVGKALGFHSGWLGFVYNLEGPEEFKVVWWISIASVLSVGPAPCWRRDLGRRGGAVEARGRVLAVHLPPAAQPLLRRRGVPAGHRQGRAGRWAGRRLVRPRRRERLRASRARARRLTTSASSASTSRRGRSRITRWVSSSASSSSRSWRSDTGRRMHSGYWLLAMLRPAAVAAAVLVLVPDDRKDIVRWLSVARRGAVRAVGLHLLRVRSRPRRRLPVLQALRLARERRVPRPARHLAGARASTASPRRWCC